MRIYEYSNTSSEKIETPETFIYVIKSVACTTRAAVLSLILKVDGACVCEVQYALEVSQPVASRSLIFLKNAGFLTSQQVANRVCYKKAEVLTPLHEAICQSVVSVFEKDPGFKLALERLNSFRKNQKGGCVNG